MKFARFVFIIIVSATGLRCSSTDQMADDEVQKLFYDTWMHPNDSLLYEARQKIATQSPKSRYGYYCRSWLLTRKNDMAKALKIADSLVMGYPDFAEGHYLHANLKEENGDPQGALESYTKTIRYKPDFAEAYINRGSIYFSKNEKEKALADFKTAEKLAPQQPIMLHNLGNAYMALGKRDSACIYWKKALANGHLAVQPFVEMYCK